MSEKADKEDQVIPKGCDKCGSDMYYNTETEQFECSVSTCEYTQEGR